MLRELNGKLKWKLSLLCRLGVKHFVQDNTLGTQTIIHERSELTSMSDSELTSFYNFFDSLEQRRAFNARSHFYFRKVHLPLCCEQT